MISKIYSSPIFKGERAIFCDYSVINSKEIESLKYEPEKEELHITMESGRKHKIKKCDLEKYRNILKAYVECGNTITYVV